MAKKTPIKYKKDALKKLRNTREGRQMLMNEAKAYQERCGGEEMGYKLTDLLVEESRTAISLMATGKARNSNRKYHTLIRKL